ncbi:hypothetical protein WHU11_26340 (plasmid) [Escherichia coli]
MSNLREYQNRIADIANALKLCLAGQALRSSVLITNSLKMMPRAPASILEAARKDPVFAGISDNATAQIATAWASALADYAAAHKSMPRPEILAPATRRWKTALIESTRNSMDATNKAMLESVAAEMMSVSDGVMRLPLFLAMICLFSWELPLMRVPSFRLRVTSPTSMKSLTWQVPLLVLMLLVMFWTCNPSVYSQLRRRYVLVASSDGTSKTATFKMEDFEGQNVPIRKGRTNIYVNRIKSVVDNGSGSLLHSFTNAAGEQITVTCSLNYNIGQIAR